MGALLGLAGCVSSAQIRRHPGLAQGTCDAACAHYVDCKGQSTNDDLHGACVAECRQVFAIDDRASLRAYESLECGDAVSFIEGTSGREPGEPTTPSTTAAITDG